MALVHQVYGPPGTVRHRSEHVKIRPDIIRRIADAELRESFAGRLRAIGL